MKTRLANMVCRLENVLSARRAVLAAALVVLGAVPGMAGAELRLSLERLDDSRIRLTGQGRLPDIPNADRPASGAVLRLVGATTDREGGATATAGFSLDGRALARVRVEAFAPNVELIFDGELTEPGGAAEGAATVTLLNESWAGAGTSGDVVWGADADAVRVGTYALIRPTNAAPVADAGGPYETLAGQPLRFDGRGSRDADGRVVRYEWNFGDGRTGDGPQPTHTYAVAGAYGIGLTVVDDEGNRSAADFTSAAVRGGPTRPDVLLRNGDDGGWFLYRLSGRSILSGASKPFKPSPVFQPVGRGDFDGNGYRDLLLRDVAGDRDGRFVLYTLEEQAILAKGDPGLPRDLSWTPVSTDDFDGDGRADVLLRDDRGAWRLHLMDGAVTRNVVRPLLPEGADVAPAATADFDGDGRADVLLRHADGGWSLYLMNGGAIKDSGAPALRNANRFTLEAVADFDGDGDDDVLMRRTATGGWRLLQMDGVVVANESWIGLAGKPRFALQAAADFNGDGRADVLLRNAGTGRWLSYRLDGPMILARGDPGLPRNLRWAFVNANDADDDGDADVLLRSATGEWKVFLFGDDLLRESKGPVDMKHDLAWQPVEE